MRHLQATCLSNDRRLYIRAPPPGYTPICLQIAVYPCDTSRLQASLPTDGCISVRHLQATRFSTEDGCISVGHLQMAVSTRETPRLYVSLPNLSATPQGYMALSADALLYLLVTPLSYQTGVSPLTPRGYTSLCRKTAVSPGDTPKLYTSLPKDFCVSPPHLNATHCCIIPRHLQATSLCRQTAISSRSTSRLYASSERRLYLPSPPLVTLNSANRRLYLPAKPPGYTSLLYLTGNLQARRHCCISRDTFWLHVTAVLQRTPPDFFSLCPLPSISLCDSQRLRVCLTTGGCISPRHLQATRLSATRRPYLPEVPLDYTRICCTRFHFLAAPEGYTPLHRQKTVFPHDISKLHGFLPTDVCIYPQYFYTTHYTPLFQQMVVSPRDISRLHASLPTDGCISTRHVQTTRLSSNRWLYLPVTFLDYTSLFQQMAVSPRDISRLHVSLPTDGCISPRHFQTIRLSSNRWLYLPATFPDYTSLFQQMAVSPRDVFDWKREEFFFNDLT
ncbi:hypothetical protein PoB_001654100 [Plakobranchus ocellatus]|uniref:Uncharacterized protein n=1 Tax=Plakobranchus ocellatus TaxID=259542 RepID=A0AAV3YSE5_9GAST|nr:hypothetical protein PoB_001654100 [Plakobranchus ocellatus]